MDEKTALLGDAPGAELLETKSVEETTLVRKIDLRIIPLVSFLYLLSFLDRSNISNVKFYFTTPIEEGGAGLTESQFSKAVSVFYIGYILFEIPANLVLKRVPPSFWIGLMVVAWGICSTAMIFVETFADLMLVRTFLGIAESGFFPGVIFYLTFWYRRREQGLRFALFYCSSALASAFGGLMSYGILQMESGVLEPWQYLFLFEGAPSVLAGIATWFLLPNFPQFCNFLTPTEKTLAVERLEHLRKHSPASKTKYVFATLRDLKIWGFMLINVCVVSVAYSISFYLSVIIVFMITDDSIEANLLTVPVWSIAAACILGIAFNSDRQREWAWHLILPSCVAVLGFVGAGLFTSPLINNGTLAYLSMFLVAMGVPPLIPVILSWMTNSIKGTTRTGTATAMVVGFGNLGGFIGPNIYGNLMTTLPTGEPTYYLAHLTNAGVMLLCVVLCVVVKLTIKDDPSDAESDDLVAEEKVALVHETTSAVSLNDGGGA